jgi:hypothetical protein
MTKDNDYQKGRKNAMLFSGAVYVGVVLAATTLFISFVLTAFPEDAYFSRLVMSVSGLMIGASMLAFPYALHVWAVSGNHRTVTTILYYIEMLIIAINTIISFGKLLATYTGYQMPEWAVLYEPFSIASIVYTLAAWGTVFLMDPEGQRNAKRRQFEEDYEDKIADMSMEFLDSKQGQDAIISASWDDIQNRISKRRHERPDFGTSRSSTPAPLDASLLIKNKSETELPHVGDSFRGDQ